MDVLDQSEIDALLNSASAMSDNPEGLSALDAPKASSRRQGPALPPQFKVHATDSQIDRLRPIQVAIRIRLAERRMTLEKIVNMTVGTIIEFSKSADHDLDLMVNNVVIGSGNAVKCGERFGLRVIRIQPWTQRILAMGLLR